MSVKTILKGVSGAMYKNAPVILTGAAVGGNIAGTIMAVKATPKALNDISEAKRKKGAELTKLEVVKACWKNYILAGATIAIANFCGIMATREGLKRSATLASAAVIAENSMREYQDKVVKVVGENKEKEIRDEIAKDKINEAVTKLPSESPKGLPQLGHGNDLFYFIPHRQWLRSDVETIRQAVNTFNQRLLGQWDCGMSENDLLMELCLGKDGSGELVGWNPNKAMCEVEFIYPDRYGDSMGYASPWGEVAIGIQYSRGHEPYLGYLDSGTYCG